MTFPPCPVYRCLGRLEPITNGHGVVSMVCPACARTAAGICLDCPRRVAPRRRRCDDCRVATVKQREKDRLPHRRLEMKFRARAYRATEEGRAATRKANNEYHKRNPYTDLDRKIRRIRRAQRKAKAQQRTAA